MVLFSQYSKSGADRFGQNSVTCQGHRQYVKMTDSQKEKRKKKGVVNALKKTVSNYILYYWYIIGQNLSMSIFKLAKRNGQKKLCLCLQFSK